ncbi:GM15463 [Drosophila sechellia]|uniref:GM15463 n=1 Tax=Drosophila sechellia TaxID=7238 RepID=B4HXE2_DROSE|nr:GM15463 [Drosophila sechellia]
MTWPNASWSARKAKDGRHICQKHCRWSGAQEKRKNGRGKELELEQEQERKDICTTLTKLRVRDPKRFESHWKDKQG